MFYTILFIIAVFFVFRYIRKESREVVEDSKKGYTITVKPIELVYDIYEGTVCYLWKRDMEDFLESLGYSDKQFFSGLNKGFYCISNEHRESDNFYTTRSYTLRVVCKNFIDCLKIREKATNLASSHRESSETLLRREAHNDKLRSTGYFQQR